MKMSEVFNGDVVVNESGGNYYLMESGDKFKGFDFEDQVEAAAHAINCHDELVTALSDLLASISGGSKTCGHDYDCICAGDAAKIALGNAKG